MAGKTLLALVVAGAFLAVSAGTSLAGGMGHKDKTSGKSEMKSSERPEGYEKRVSGTEEAWRLQEPVETGAYPRIHWEEPSVRTQVGDQEFRTIDLGP